MRRSVVVRIPSSQRSRILEEQGELGLASALDTMEHILGDYFSRKQQQAPAPPVTAALAQDCPLKTAPEPNEDTGRIAVGSDGPNSKVNDAGNSVADDQERADSTGCGGNRLSPVTAQLAGQIVELSVSLGSALQEVQRWQAEAKRANDELEQWKTMVRHAPVPEILDHLAYCRRCRPEFEMFLAEYVDALPAEKTRELARKQKWWPPPPIEIVTRNGRL